MIFKTCVNGVKILHKFPRYMRYWTLRSDINIDYLAKVELLKTRLNRLLVFKEAQEFIWQKTVSMFNKVKHDGNECKS